MLRIAVLGSGRMGREVVRAIASCDELTLAGVWARSGMGLGADLIAAHPGPIVSGDAGEVLAAADIAVDFTLPAATLGVLEAVLAAGKPLVCGVTGLRDAELRRMRDVSKSVPLFYDRNMSLGVAVLKDLVSRAAALLGPGFVADIEDRHHVHKKDAPSGTALALGEALARSRGASFADVFRYETGRVAARRSPDDIVFSAIREGEVAGEHGVVFRSGVERLELRHEVADRRVFAEGALRAARWLAAQDPGLYCMQDLLEDGFPAE